MKTYEYERDEECNNIAIEIFRRDGEGSCLQDIKEGYDVGHARAQARIKELEGDCQRKDALLMIAKESIDDSNKYLKLRLDEIQYLQTKLESCEKLKDDFAQLNHTLCHDLTVAKAENKRLEIDFQNNYRWRVLAVEKLRVAIPKADVAPLVDSLEALKDRDQYDSFDVTAKIINCLLALAAFNAKYCELTKENL